MNKKEVLQLNAVFAELRKSGKANFKYSVLKNISALKDEVSPLEEVQSEMNDVLKEFHQERNQYILDHGTHSEDGSVSLPLNDKEILNAFSAFLTALKEKYTEQVAKYDKMVSDFEVVLAEEVPPIEFRKINITECPDEIDDTWIELLMKHGVIE